MPRKSTTPEPIWQIRNTGDMLWAWKFTNLSKMERRIMFGAVAKSTKDLTVRRACKVLIKYNRDELAEMVRGSYMNLLLCFRWDWFKAYKREWNRLSRQKARNN